MLPLTMFSFHIQYMNIIQYYTCASITNAEPENELDEKDLAEICLNTRFSIKTFNKSDLNGAFPRTNGYIQLGFLEKTGLVMNILKKKFLGSSLRISHDNNLLFDKEFEINVEVDDALLYFFLSNEEWNTILENIIKYENNENFRFEIKTTNGKCISLLHLQCIDRIHVRISRTEDKIYPDLLNLYIKEDFFTYYISYKTYVTVLIKNLKKEFENHKFIVSTINDNINFHFDKTTFMFLYATKYIPLFDFFGEFSMKLRPLKEEYYNTPLLISFKCTPSVFIEFKRLNTTSRNILSLQLTQYDLFEHTQMYFSEKNRSKSYINLDFTEKKFTNISQELDVFMHILKRDEVFIICLEFENIMGLNLIEIFKKSLNPIEIETHTNEAKPSTIKFNNFHTKIDNHTYKIHFNITKMSSDTNTNVLYHILENKEGFFNIKVLSYNKAIIESKIFLAGDILILSSNKLKEHIQEIRIKTHDRFVDMSHKSTNINDSINNEKTAENKNSYATQQQRNSVKKYSSKFVKEFSKYITTPQLSTINEKSKAEDSNSLIKKEYNKTRFSRFPQSTQNKRSNKIVHTTNYNLTKEYKKSDKQNRLKNQFVDSSNTIHAFNKKNNLNITQPETKPSRSKHGDTHSSDPINVENDLRYKQSISKPIDIKETDIKIKNNQSETPISIVNTHKEESKDLNKNKDKLTSFVRKNEKETFPPKINVDTHSKYEHRPSETTLYSTHNTETSPNFEYSTDNEKNYKGNNINMSTNSMYVPDVRNNKLKRIIIISVVLVTIGIGGLIVYFYLS